MKLQHGQITETLSFLDNGLLGYPGVGTTYILRGDEVAIVETGTSLCAPVILEGLAALDVRPEEVRHILVTHLHMDHAGGAGVLVDTMPEARVYLHGSSHEYLVDPSRLLRSAERALGDLWAAHGTIVPLAPEKLLPAENLDLDLGRGIRVRAIPTPGHSPDHLAYHELSMGALFAGDAAGIVLPALHYLGPVTPPPAVDVEAQHATFRTLLDMPIQRLLFSHWGQSQQPAHEVILRLRESFERFDRLIEVALDRGDIDAEAIVRDMLPKEPLPAYGEWVIAGWVKMSIAGMVRYHTKRREAEAS